MAEAAGAQGRKIGVLVTIGLVVLLAVGSCTAALGLLLLGPKKHVRGLTLESRGAPVEILVDGRSLGRTPLVLDDEALEPYWRADFRDEDWPVEGVRSYGSSAFGGHRERRALVSSQARSDGENTFYLREEVDGVARYLVLRFRAIGPDGAPRGASAQSTDLSSSPFTTRVQHCILVE